MRVRDNRLASLLRFFNEELSGIYDPGEIQALFFTAAEHYLGWNRSLIAARLKENINQSELLLLYDCAKALARHEPLQYILGTAWFCDLKLAVNRHVLIPRPETEELVHLALGKFPKTGARVLDIGTGSGCIALAVKNARPEYQVFACDNSDAALEIAKTNSVATGLAVSFFSCDILNEGVPGSFDMVISNPPYIEPGEAQSMGANVLAHEPHGALFAPPGDPVIFYRRITDICLVSLSRGGVLFFELNPLTAHDVLEYAAGSGIFSKCELVKDMSGKQRFLYAQKN